jgi:S-(hydroxymethyl)glutathione dehydrogenase/alcohol dehydrogenase
MKSRAALFWGPGSERPWSVETVQLDEPADDAVVVRMVAVGLCGSDLHVVRGDWQRPLPMILGHEGSGIVEAVGSAVREPRVGDHVVLSWGAGCGSCAACARRRPATCAKLRDAIAAGTLLGGSTGVSFDGNPVYRMTALGALAERVVVPAASAVPVPEDLPAFEAALLGCAAMTGVGAVLNAARVAKNSSVVVIGAGGVGQFVIQGSRMAGAAEVIAVDPTKPRRQQALRLGATTAVEPEEAVGVVHELAPEGVDYAFEAVGLPHAQQLAVDLTRPGGTITLVGMAAGGARLDLDPAEFSNREKILTGSLYGSDDPATGMAALVERARAGELQLAPLLGPSFPLDAVEDAMAVSLDGSQGRVIVDCRG